MAVQVASCGVSVTSSVARSTADIRSALRTAKGGVKKLPLQSDLEVDRDAC